LNYTPISLIKISSISAVIGGLLMMVTFFYLFFRKDKTIQETRSEEFSGVVLEKYRIEYEHDSPVIKILLKDKSINKIYLNHYNADIFRTVRLGDTISTKTGDTVVYINRKDTSFIVYKTDYPAD
jgi:hypothetical protein